MPPRPPSYRNPVLALARQAGRAPKPDKGDAHRPHSRARGYDRQWERLRGMHLKDNPWCVMCLAKGIATPATVADHKITIEERPDLRLDPANLQSLCDHHHNSAKQREDHRRRRAARLDRLGGGAIKGEGG